VGSIVWHKGVHVLLAAARRLKGAFEISVHGDVNIDPEYTRELRIASDGLPVRFAGPFARETAADVYGAIDVLVVPSIWPENAPLVVQEARLFGVPVVASRTGGLPEFVNDNVDGLLFTPGAVEELQRILQQLVDDRHELARLVEASVGVRSMADDAAEWERRYATLTSFDPHSDVERREGAARAAGCDRAAEQAS
jgi:glycosyltransferase involved in cell wall biosynthesis